MKKLKNQIHKETNEHRNVCKYLSIKYPQIFYISDLISFLSKNNRLTLGVMRKKNSPDIFIAAPRGRYYGLFIEMKKSCTKLINKNGKIPSELQEQYKVLIYLRSIGYAAYFAAGYDEAIKIIDEYLKS